MTVAELASRAVAAALAGPEVGPGQWVYRRNAVVAVPAQADNPVVVERWLTADRTTGAAYVDGELEVGPWAWPVGPDGEGTSRRGASHPEVAVEGSSRQWPIDRWPIGRPGRQSVRSELTAPHIGYAALGSLPDDPDELVELLANTPVPRDDPAYNAGHAFEMIGGLFQRLVMPPAATARVFGALAAIPGVTAHDDAADAAGNHGVGFLLAEGVGGNQEILVGAQTYRFQGYQFLDAGRDLRSGSAWGVAVLRQEMVSGPGVRP